MTANRPNTPAACPFSPWEMVRARTATTVLLAACLALASSAGCSMKAGASEDDSAASHARSQVESGPVRVTVEVSPAKPRLSDSPTLTLTIDHAEGVTVEKPPFGDSIGRFAIRDLREPLPKTNNGRVIEQQIYTLEPTEAGRSRIDPIGVSFVDQRPNGDAKQQTIETEPLSIEVSSLLGDKTPSLGDLRPPAAPMALDSRLPGWVWAIAALAIVGIAIALRRKHRAVRVGGRPVKILTPEELANLELDKLVASGLAASDIKQFYVELTAIVRRYIERTTGIRAPEQTTEEFLREISRTGAFAEDVRMRLRGFLESADLVKFAAHRPNAEDVDESVRRARLFIKTKEAPDVAGRGVEQEQPC